MNINKILSFSAWKNYPRNRLLSIKQSVNEKLVLYFYSRLNYDLDNALIIFGAPRSGTTWLMEILSSIKGIVPNFEPFHRFRGITKNRIDPTTFYPTYKPADETMMVDFLVDVFSGRLFNPWTVSLAKLWHFRKPRFLLSKTVRANRLVPLILREIAFPHPPVVIIRHPVPTCQSQLSSLSKNAKAPRLTPAKIDNSSHLIRQHKKILLAKHSDLAYQVILWCLDHIDYLQSPESHEKSVITFYEDLLTSPLDETSRIIRQMKISNVSSAEIRSINFTKASRTDFNKDYRASIVNQLNKGLNRLSVEEKKDIQDILDYFEIKIYSVSSPTPNKKFLAL